MSFVDDTMKQRVNETELCCKLSFFHICSVRILCTFRSFPKYIQLLFMVLKFFLHSFELIMNKEARDIVFCFDYYMII